MEFAVSLYIGGLGFRSLAFEVWSSRFNIRHSECGVLEFTVLQFRVWSSDCLEVLDTMLSTTRNINGFRALIAYLQSTSSMWSLNLNLDALS